MCSGLQNASLLEREEKVTCETPAVLKGQPVWNVSECVNSTVSPSTYYTHKQPTAASITVPTLIGVIGRLAIRYSVVLLEYPSESIHFSNIITNTCCVSCHVGIQPINKSSQFKVSQSASDKGYVL